MSYTYGLWIFILSALIISLLIMITWHRRHNPAGRAFLIFMFCALVWTAAFTLEIAAQSLELKLFFCRVQFVGIAFIPLAWLYLTLRYIGWERPWRDWIVLSIIPVITNILIWFVPYPNWFWQEPHLVVNAAPFTLMNYDYGAWFYFVHVPYSYLLLLAALMMLIRSIIKTHFIYRRQMIILVVALLLPIITDILYILGASPVAHYNYSTAVFSVSCLMIAWALFRYKFLDLLPMARDTVVENMEDGVIVLDLKERLVDLNPSARRFTGFSTNDLGRSVLELDTDLLHCAFEKMKSTDNFRVEIITNSPEQLVYDTRCTLIKDRNGEIQGRIITIRDITEHHRLFKKIQEMAIHDELTGIFNRRYLFELGQQEANRIKRRKDDSSLSLIMMDLDNLKQINDTYGHAAGDQALITLTECCKKYLRPYDSFGRLGGDEFAFILPETTLEEAITVGKRVHNSIKQLQINTGQIIIYLTASLGVVSSQELNLAEFDFAQLLARADELMYQAKKQGKNQLFSSLG